MEPVAGKLYIATNLMEEFPEKFGKITACFFERKSNKFNGSIPEG